MKRRSFIANSLAGGIGWALASSKIAAPPLLAARSKANAMGRHEPFKGVFPIMQTPYLQDEEIDAESMARQVEFVIDGGGGGMVWPQLASEFYTLTDEERMETAELIVERCAGRLPVIIGVQSTNHWRAALKLAKHAESIGADGIISLPPYTSRATVDRAADYYRALAQTVDLPIFIQNSGGSYGPALPTDRIIELAKEYPSIAYIKEEARPVTHRIGAMVRDGEGVLRGVFSGAWGSSLLNELRRGCVGTMPGSSIVDIYAQVIDLFLSGQRAEAQSLFDKAIAMVTFKRPFSVQIEKEILRRRGIFTNTLMRVSPYTLDWDDVDREEFDTLFSNLAPYFKA